MYRKKKSMPVNDIIGSKMLHAGHNILGHLYQHLRKKTHVFIIMILSEQQPRESTFTSI